MKSNFIKRIITLTIISATLLTALPIGASASWRQDSNGWWNTEGNSYSVGWRQIDGKWYYFDYNGYMAKNTTIDACKLGSDGAWIQTAPPIINNTSNISNNTNNTVTNSKIYSAGEKWIVDGQWEFTINSVKKTDDRNQFSDKNPAQVLLIDYSYKNLGYVGSIQDLYFSNFTVMDEKGEVAETYPATISNYPKPTPIGSTCSNAMVAYGVKNKSSYVTIQVNQYKSGYTGQEKATFKVPIE